MDLSGKKFGMLLSTGLDHADLVTYCGLVVLTDLINATERFIALN